MANAKEARIDMYMHCKTCVPLIERDGKREVIDLGERLAFGYTKEGFQLVCENCGKNVIDIDLLSQRVVLYDKKKTLLQRLAMLQDLIKSYKKKK